MIIKLIIDGKERTFKPGFISGRRLRETMEMNEELEGKKTNGTTLDSMVDYLVNLFGKQFTRDEFYDGIASDKITDTFVECVQGVMGKLVNKSKLLEVSEPKTGTAKNA